MKSIKRLNAKCLVTKCLATATIISSNSYQSEMKVTIKNPLKKILSFTPTIS